MYEMPRRSRRALSRSHMSGVEPELRLDVARDAVTYGHQVHIQLEVGETRARCLAQVVDPLGRGGFGIGGRQAKRDDIGLAGGQFQELWAAAGDQDGRRFLRWAGRDLGLV